MPDTSDSDSTLTDPVTEVRRLQSLDPDAIRDRLADLEDERAALMTLLRATRTARRRDRQQGAVGQGGSR
jgi:hypothetical protein